MELSNRARRGKLRPCCSQWKCLGTSNIVNSTPLLAASRRTREVIHGHNAMSGQENSQLSTRRDVLYNHVGFPVSEPIDCPASLQRSMLQCSDTVGALIGSYKACDDQLVMTSVEGVLEACSKTHINLIRSR
jgi:hypothetical protein